MLFFAVSVVFLLIWQHANGKKQHLFLVHSKYRAKLNRFFLQAENDEKF